MALRMKDKNHEKSFYTHLYSVYKKKANSFLNFSMNRICNVFFSAYSPLKSAEALDMTQAG